MAENSSLVRQSWAREGKVEEMARKARNLEGQLRNTIRFHNRKEDESEALTSIHQGIEAKFQTILDEKDVAIRSQKKVFEEEKAGLQLVLEGKESHIDSLNRAFGAQVSDLQTKLVEKTSECKALASRIDGLEASSNITSIHQLSEDIKSELNKLHDDALGQEMRQQVDQFEREKAALVGNLKETHETATRNLIDDHNLAVDRLVSKWDLYVQAMQVSHQAEIRRIQNNVATPALPPSRNTSILQGRIVSLNETVAALEKELEAEAHLKTELISKCSQFQVELTVASSNKKEIEVELQNCKSLINTMTAYSETTNARRDAMEKSVADSKVRFEQEQASLQRQILEKNDLLVKQEVARGTLHEEIVRKDNYIAQTEGAFTQARREYKDMQEQVRLMAENRDSLTKQLEQARATSATGCEDCICAQAIISRMQVQFKLQSTALEQQSAVMDCIRAVQEEQYGGLTGEEDGEEDVLVACIDDLVNQKLAVDELRDQHSFGEEEDVSECIGILIQGLEGEVTTLETRAQDQSRKFTKLSLEHKALTDSHHALFRSAATNSKSLKAIGEELVDAGVVIPASIDHAAGVKALSQEMLHCKHKYNAAEQHAEMLRAMGLETQGKLDEAEKRIEDWEMERDMLYTDLAHQKEQVGTLKLRLAGAGSCI